MDKDDAGWFEIVSKVGDNPDRAKRFATLPFYMPLPDNKQKRVEAKCYIIKADHRTTEQMHFYLESNAVIAEPTNAGITIHASSQSPSECQAQTAGVLGVKTNFIDVQVKQIGGGYGGKTVRSPYHAAAAASICKMLGRPAKLAIERETDTAITGRRHAYFLRVYLAIVADDTNPELKEHRGTIAGFYLQAWSDSGQYYDCCETVLNVAIEDSDGPYYSALSRAEGQMLRTNKVANTAFRAFGHGSIMAVENAIEAAGHCPYIFDQDGRGNSTSIRIRSMYKLNQSTPYGSVLTDYILDKMFYTMRGSNWYRERIAAIRAFNKTQRWKKRGHCLQPAKYKVGFELGSLEQGHAIVNIFKNDGSVLVMHDGVEIGQGLSTKVIQIAATELGLPIELIQIGTTGAKVTPNPTSTGASSGSEIKGGATRNACQILAKRLSDWCHEFYDKNFLIVQQGGRPLDDNWELLAFWNNKRGWAGNWPPASPGGAERPIWPIIISSAYNQRVDLSAEGFYTNPYFNLNPSSPTPQVFGFVYCCAYSEVEIDVLSGDTTIVETRLVVDAGKSMNPAVDVGQIEGAFLQGVGSILSENVLFQPDGDYKGAMVSQNTWEYKPPFPRDIPLKWWTNIFPSEKYRVRLNKNLVMSSKAMGEPPFVLSTSVYCGLKEAIYAARLENLPEPENRDWFVLQTPVTPQDVRAACGVNPKNYVFSDAKPTPIMVPCATEKLLEHIEEYKLADVVPPSLNLFASLNRKASIKGKYSSAAIVQHALADSLQRFVSAPTGITVHAALLDVPTDTKSSGLLSGSTDFVMSASNSSVNSLSSQTESAPAVQKPMSASGSVDSFVHIGSDSPQIKSRKSKRDNSVKPSDSQASLNESAGGEDIDEEKRKAKERRREERAAAKAEKARQEAEEQAALERKEKEKRKKKEKEKEKSKSKGKL